MKRLFFLAFAMTLPVSGLTQGVPVEAALKVLKLGNDLYSSDAPQTVPLDTRRRTLLAKGQHPYAIVLSCADSRVPPEILFNVGLGDIFVVRSAGQVADRSVLASIEYAAEHLHVPLLIVMGHSACGAVKASWDNAKKPQSLGPNLDYLLQAISPAVARSKSLDQAIQENVRQVMSDVVNKSHILNELYEHNVPSIGGAQYLLDNVRVEFYPDFKPELARHVSQKDQPTRPEAAQAGH